MINSEYSTGRTTMVKGVKMEVELCAK